MAGCDHLQSVDAEVRASGDVCQSCVEQGLRWVALRKCLTCGHVGCCDSSSGRHARKHFNDTGHPIIQPHRATDWKWCYVHDAYV